jgi:hypothetical protein
VDDGNYDVNIGSDDRTVQIGLHTEPVAENDVCATASVISLGEIMTEDLKFASSDEDLIPTCMAKHAYKFDKGIWYQYTGNGGIIKATTCVEANTVETILAVFTGADCGSLECVGFSTGWSKDEDKDTMCNDITFQTEIGRKYWILVDERATTPMSEVGVIGLKIEEGFLSLGVMQTESSKAQFCAGKKGKVWGDPHFVTYDGFKYDCQGEGDFVISKSLQSVFEIHGRFGLGTPSSQVTVMRGVAWKIEDDSNNVEVLSSSNDEGTCLLELYVGDKLVGPSTLPEATPFAVNFKAAEYSGTKTYALIFTYESSGTRLEVTTISSKKNGCVINLQVCLADVSSLEPTSFVGMLGSPDENKQNDWMNEEGEIQNLPTSTRGRMFSEAYNYCVSNWCLSEGSFFKTDTISSCTTPYNPEFEEEFGNLSQEDKNACTAKPELCVEIMDGGQDSLEEANVMTRFLDDLKNTPAACNFEDLETIDVKDDSIKEDDKQVVYEITTQFVITDEVVEADESEVITPTNTFDVEDEGGFDLTEFSLTDESGAIPSLSIPQGGFDFPGFDVTDESGAIPSLSIPQEGFDFAGFTVSDESGAIPSPPEDEEPQDEKAPLGAFGDPHITLWTGQQYDFHGACDLVLVQNPSFRDGLGLTVHLRTKFTKLWSFIESAVLRIGSDTLELKGNKQGTLYWMNGVFQGDISQGMGGYPVEFEHTSSVQKQFVVSLDGKEKIVLKTFKNMVRVDILSPTGESFGSSEGLMGKHPTGEMLSRDGKSLIDDVNSFGREWQVLFEEDMLFHKVQGVQAPKICPLPDVTARKQLRARRLSESTLTEEDAKLVCGRVNPKFFNACVFDVLAMNDKDVAESF